MTQNAMNMTAAEYRAARATVIRDSGTVQYSSDARRSDAGRLVRLRAKHPDLTAAAAELARQAHRAAVRVVVGAHAELQAAAVDERPAVQMRYDTAVAEAERLHAASLVAA